MSTKPTDEARWAETAGGTPAANIVDPSSGQKDTGWTTNQIPPSAYFNDWMRKAYKWFEYLNDGALQGAHTFDSTVGVTGLITATAGVTAAANQHVTVSGTGQYKHGDRVYNFSPADAKGINATDEANIVRSLGTLTLAGAPSGSDLFVLGFTLPAGKRIKTITYNYDRGGAGTILIDCLRFPLVYAGSGTTVHTQISDAASGSAQANTATIGGGGHTVLTTHFYQFQFSLSDAANTIQGISVVCDEP